MNELELWEKYKKGDENAAKELYRQMKPAIDNNLFRWRFSGVPVKAIETEARRLFMEALNSYDPNRGASLKTHVINMLNFRINRFVNTYQNLARITQSRQYDITPYQIAKANLAAELGREPTTKELAEELKWSERAVINMQKSLRQDYSIERATREGLDIGTQETSRLKDTIYFVSRNLNPEEKMIINYTLGMDGYPKLTGKEIARRLNISESKVTRTKQKFAKLVEQYS